MCRSNFKSCGMLCVALIFTMDGCHGNINEPDTLSFKVALNDHYRIQPICVWNSPVKLPAQVDASNDIQTKGFDALTDAGLLTRKAEEKKRFLIGSKQVTDYDVSDTGRTQWRPDTSQPGYGNFCYGHRQVTSIDSFTPVTAEDGAKVTTVNYHYEMTDVPDWAQSAETKTAFPKVPAALAGPQPAAAKLVQTQNGWQVSH
jgi:hypothetical protein